MLLGLEFNAVEGEVVPTANYTLLNESEHAPLLVLGTSSDRIFSPKGTQAYYLTVGKSILGGHVSPYFNLTYSEWEEKMTFPFGASLKLAPTWDLMYQNDGTNSHMLLNWKGERENVSLLLVKMRYWGISTGVKF